MTTTLYRPIGIKELSLIIESEFKKFPPRLEWQPIFYPVMNQEYAEQIATKWNLEDEFSGYCGIVTSFQLPTEYLKKFEIHNVGGFIHNELWVPSEDLEEFNQHIIDRIEIVKTFVGDKFDLSSEDVAHQLVRQYL